MSNLIKHEQTTKTIKQTNVNTDEQFVDLWLYGRPPTTTRTYKTISKQFLSFVGKPIRTIQLEDIHGWCSYLNTKGYKPTTIKNKINTIKSMFSFARRVGYCQIDKGIVIKAPKLWNELAQRIVSKEEVNRLITGGKSVRDRKIMETLYTLGLRVNELHQLDWADLRIDSFGCARVTIKGKGSKTRVINIPNDLYQKLLSLKSNQPWMFSNRYGQRLSTRSVNVLIKKAAKRAGVTDKISAHWFRHAHASHSLEVGCDLPLLQQSLGHSSLAVTSVYLHVNPDRSSSQFIQVKTV